MALPVIAAEGGDDLSAYREASSKFAALVTAAEVSKSRQQLQTKDVAPLVAELSDERRFLKSGPYAVSELGKILELCGMANKAVMSLALFDVKSHIDPKSDPQAVSRQTVALMDTNAAAFGALLEQLHPFLVRCTAKEVPPITEFTLSLKPEQLTEERRKGLAQVRTGMVELFVGSLLSVNNPKYDERYRKALVQSLADSAGPLVSTLPITTRQQIDSTADSVAKNSSVSFTASLETIRAALRDKTCKGLCAL